MLIRWSLVRVQPPQPLSFQRLSRDHRAQSNVWAIPGVHVCTCRAALLHGRRRARARRRITSSAPATACRLRSIVPLQLSTCESSRHSQSAVACSPRSRRRELHCLDGVDTHRGRRDAPARRRSPNEVASCNARAAAIRRGGDGRARGAPARRFGLGGASIRWRSISMIPLR